MLWLPDSLQALSCTSRPLSNVRTLWRRTLIPSTASALSFERAACLVLLPRSPRMCSTFNASPDSLWPASCPPPYGSAAAVIKKTASTPQATPLQRPNPYGDRQLDASGLAASLLSGEKATAREQVIIRFTSAEKPLQQARLLGRCVYTKFRGGRGDRRAWNLERPHRKQSDHRGLRQPIHLLLPHSHTLTRQSLQRRSRARQAR